jgi:maltose alpha-D-glucosyltransferase / alpha-amylase
VLFTGKDFYIIDFEGEPARSFSERRLKRSPLRDVAGMLRSFHYATYSALFKHTAIRQEDVEILEKWAELWYHYISGIFIKNYLQAVAKTKLIPDNQEDLETMLNTYILEKAVYELNYELNNRPDWVIIPVKGIKSIMQQQ